VHGCRRVPRAGLGRPTAGLRRARRLQWLCLDHVRAFNNPLQFLQRDEAARRSRAAQTPYGGWDRETRAFAAPGGSPPPRWADFTDPLDAIGARFRRAPAGEPRKDGRELSDTDRKSLRVLGSEPMPTGAR
jgi:hypothetical protein